MKVLVTLFNLFLLLLLTSLHYSATAQTAPEGFSPLVAVDDYFSFVNNELLEFNVLLNDGCAYEGHPDCENIQEGLMIAEFTQPEHGEIVQEDNYFIYTPNPGFEGYDAFTYAITNAQGHTDVGIVYLHVGSTAIATPFATPPCFPWPFTLTCPIKYECGLICNPNVGLFDWLPWGTWAPGWRSLTDNPDYRCTDPLSNDNGFINMHRKDDCYGDAVVTDFVTPLDPAKIQILTYKRRALGEFPGDVIRFRLSNAPSFWNNCLYNYEANSSQLYDDNVFADPSIKTVAKCFINTSPYDQQLGIYPKVTNPTPNSNLIVELDQIEVMEYPYPFYKDIQVDSCCITINDTLVVEACNNTWTDWQWFKNGVPIHTGDTLFVNDYVCERTEYTAQLVISTDIQDHGSVPPLVYGFVYDPIKEDCCCEDYLKNLGTAIQCDLSTSPPTLCPPTGTLPGDRIDWDVDCDGTVDAWGWGNFCYQPTGFPPGPHAVCMKLTRIIKGDTCEVDFCKIIELEETDCTHFYETVDCDDLYFDYSAYPNIAIHRTSDIDDNDHILLDLDCDGIAEINGPALGNLPYNFTLPCGWHCVNYIITRTLPDGTVCERFCEDEFYIPCEQNKVCCPCDEEFFNMVYNASYSDFFSGLTGTFFPNADLSEDCDDVYWDFGDGNTSNSLGNQTVTHTYTAPGIYNVCMTVTRTSDDGNDCPPIKVCREFVVSEKGNDCCEECEIDMRLNANVYNNCYWVFNFSPNVYLDPSCTPLAYFWDFGDGNSSTLMNPQHAYTIQWPDFCKDFTVRLIVKYQAPDGEICFKEASKRVRACGLKGTIGTVPVIFDFDYYNTLDDLNIPFFPTGDINEVDIISWDFGDGTVDTTQGFSTVFHQYEENKEYNVCMSVKRYTSEEGDYVDLGKECKLINKTTGPPLELPYDYDYIIKGNPTPHTTHLLFNTPVNKGQLELLNMNGQQVGFFKLESQQAIDVDMSDLPTGTYLFVLRRDGYVIPKKVLKE